MNKPSSNFFVELIARVVCAVIVAAGLTCLVMGAFGCSIQAVELVRLGGGWNLSLAAAWFSLALVGAFFAVITLFHSLKELSKPTWL